MQVLQKGLSEIPHLKSCVPKSVLPSLSLARMSAASLLKYFECRLVLACLIYDLDDMRL